MTAQFISTLDVRKVGTRGGRAIWKLLAPLKYDSPLLGGRVIVPAGFLTDLASVPRLPLAFLLAGDTAHAQAVVHDFLYQNRAAILYDQQDQRLGLRRVKRKLADAVFSEASEALNDSEPGWRRTLMWVALRLGGWVAWRKPSRRKEHLRQQAQPPPTEAP